MGSTFNLDRNQQHINIGKLNQEGRENGLLALSPNAPDEHGLGLCVSAIVSQLFYKHMYLYSSSLYTIRKESQWGSQLETVMNFVWSYLEPQICQDFKHLFDGFFFQVQITECVHLFLCESLFQITLIIKNTPLFMQACQKLMLQFCVNHFLQKERRGTDEGEKSQQAKLDLLNKILSFYNLIRDQYYQCTFLYTDNILFVYVLSFFFF